MRKASTIDSRRFNGEAVQIYHPRSANTDGQLIVLFRDSDVLVAGDVVDMTGYPVIDVKRAAGPSTACWSRSTR